VRLILDTNVLVSGIFFSGVPAQILTAWADEQVSLVLSPAILDEYARVALSSRRSIQNGAWHWSRSLI